MFEKRRVEPNVLKSKLHMQVQEEIKLRKKNWAHMVEDQTEYNVEFELWPRGKSGLSETVVFKYTSFVVLPVLKEEQVITSENLENKRK